MKLVKLSLAAVVAAGSFSFANAVALDEAIQNVDLSGYLRYRYDSQTSKSGDVKDRNKAQTHKYKAHLKLTSDIADNFQAVAVLQYNSDNDRSYRDESYIHENGFNVRDAYLSYTNFDTTISFGKMEIGSIWTDDLLGTGIKVTNNSIEGVTLAAFAFDNYNADSDFFGYDIDKADVATVAATAINADTNRAGDVNIALGADKYNIRANNLYGIAALVDFAPVSAELWVGYMNKIGTFYAVDLGFNGGDEDFGYNVHAQYAGNSLKGDFKKDLNAKNGNFYGIEAGVNVAGLDANLGYVGFGDKKKYSLNSIEDKGQLIDSGEIVMDNYNGSIGKADFVFGTVGYTYDAVRFGVDVISGKVKVEGDEKVKLFEVTPRLSYKYSDKLVFSSYYAYAKEKQGNDKDTIKEIRLEAKYSF